jgi:hypothetical protein
MSLATRVEKAAKTPRGARVITGLGTGPEWDFRCLARHIVHFTFFNNAQGDH